MENQTKVKGKKNTMFKMTIIGVVFGSLLVILALLSTASQFLGLIGEILIFATPVFGLAMAAIYIIKIVYIGKGKEMSKIFEPRKFKIINIVNLIMIIIGSFLQPSPFILSAFGADIDGVAIMALMYSGVGIILIIALETLIIESMNLAKIKKGA